MTSVTSRMTIQAVSRLTAAETTLVELPAALKPTIAA